MATQNKIIRNTGIVILHAGIILTIFSINLPRAFISAGTILFISGSLFFVHKNIFSAFLLSPLRVGISILFIVPLISGIWSENTETWQDTVRIKLPLILLPMAFSAHLPITKMEWKIYGFFFVAVIIAGTFYSIYGYLQDASALNEAYLSSKIISTPLGNDHVRFSWLVSIAIFFSMWHLRSNEFKLPLPAMVFIIAWLIIFLHILGSRMGLITFYLGAGCFLIAHVKNSPAARICLLILLLLPGVAYFLLPTFKNRIKYLKYDASFYLNGNYKAGTTDGNRVASYACGIEVLGSNLLYGVGAGDVHEESVNCYNEKNLAMEERDRILPGSEILMYGLFAGIAGVLLFLFAMAALFLESTRASLFWNIICSTAIFTLIFDIGLEVQYGVIGFSFLLLSLHDYLIKGKKN